MTDLLWPMLKPAALWLWHWFGALALFGIVIAYCIRPPRSGE